MRRGSGGPARVVLTLVLLAAPAAAGTTGAIGRPAIDVGQCEAGGGHQVFGPGPSGRVCRGGRWDGLPIDRR